LQSKTDFDHDKVKNWDDFWTHVDERAAYCRQDVIAQHAVADIAFATFFKEFGVGVGPFVSLSHYAFGVFTTMLPRKDLLFRTRIEDEAAMREAYRGGRLVLTYPFWICNLFDEIIAAKDDPIELARLQDILTDYIVYLDKNSLYPSVMFEQRYPCGDYKKVVVEDDTKMVIILNRRKKTAAEKLVWEQRLIQVDITCPKDIYVGFLMSRDEHKKNEQNLNPKVKTWYTGPEILEAVKIGYVVTKVHAYYQWDHYLDIFTEFIGKAWKLKANSKNGTAPYLIAKMIMNALSGKFGQKNVDQMLRLLVGEKLTQEAVSSFTTKLIFNEAEDELLGGLVVEEMKHSLSSYPIHLSSFILGQSKVSMSRFMRKANAYKIPANVPVYGDTDSLLMRYLTIVTMAKELFGAKLGQMKDEMEGLKIIGLLILGPKMYMKLWLEWNKEYEDKETKKMKLTIPGKPKDTWVLMSSFTSKGIPHIRNGFPAFDSYEISEEEKKEVLNIYAHFEARSNNEKTTKDYYHHVVLQKFYFVRSQEGNITSIKDRLVWDDVRDLLEAKCVIDIYFGGMKRKLNEFNIKDVGVGMDYFKRGVGKNLYWNQNNRMFSKEFSVNPLSFPLGHDSEEDSLGFDAIPLRFSHQSQ
jgi:hypothetical protein